MAEDHWENLMWGQSYEQNYLIIDSNIHHHNVGPNMQLPKVVPTLPKICAH